MAYGQSLGFQCLACITMVTKYSFIHATERHVAVCAWGEGGVNVSAYNPFKANHHFSFFKCRELSGVYWFWLEITFRRSLLTVRSHYYQLLLTITSCTTITITTTIITPTFTFSTTIITTTAYYYYCNSYHTITGFTSNTTPTPITTNATTFASCITSAIIVTTTITTLTLTNPTTATTTSTTSSYNCYYCNFY